MEGKREGTYYYLPAVVVLVGLPVDDFDAGCEELFFGVLEGSGHGWMGPDASEQSALVYP